MLVGAVFVGLGFVVIFLIFRLPEAPYSSQNISRVTPQLPTLPLVPSLPTPVSVAPVAVNTLPSGDIEPVLPASPASALPSSSITMTSSARIDFDDSTSWPRYTFKELGFSVQLPFSRVVATYIECRNYKAYDSHGREVSGFCDNEQHYYSYFANSDMPEATQRHFFTMGSITKNFTGGRDWTPNLMYNFHPIGPNYGYGDAGTNTFIMHPLAAFKQEGREVVIFDEDADFYSLIEEFGPPPPERVLYGIAVKLDGNTVFKAANFEYQLPRGPHSLEQVKNIARSITFE